MKWLTSAELENIFYPPCFNLDEGGYAADAVLKYCVTSIQEPQEA